MREGDAEPDEIAIIPEPQPVTAHGDRGPPSPGPGGKPIPKTVVKETPDIAGSQTHPEKKHKADPPADLVLKADGTVEDGDGVSGTDA